MSPTHWVRTASSRSCGLCREVDAGVGAPCSRHRPAMRYGRGLRLGPAGATGGAAVSRERRAVDPLLGSNLRLTPLHCPGSCPGPETAGDAVATAYPRYEAG